MSSQPTPDIERVIRHGTAIDDAIVLARRRVVERHRKLQVPLVIWRDGRVVEVSPDQVALPEKPNAPVRGAC